MFSALGNIITVPFAALMRWLYALTGSYGEMCIRDRFCPAPSRRI